MLAQEIAGLGELRLAVILVRHQHAVFHFAVRHHDDEQHAFFGQAQEFDLAHGDAGALGCGHHAGELGEFGQQIGGLGQQACRVVGLQLAFQLLHARFGQRLHHHQGVDEQAVTQGGGHASGGGVRAGDQPHGFQVGHHVADGGGADFQAGKLLQRARTHRLSIADIAFHQGFEQDLCAIIQHGSILPFALSLNRAYGLIRHHEIPLPNHRADRQIQIAGDCRAFAQAGRFSGGRRADRGGGQPDRRTSHKHPYEVLALEEMGGKVDLAIVLGGDGTLLNIARMLAPFDIPLVGVNQGRLGFLTDISIDTMQRTISGMLRGDFVTEKRMLLSASISRGEKHIFESLAFNDVVIHRGNNSSMLEFEVRIDGEYLYNQRADGLIVATPTGSTAYALSAGGPILHPSLEVIALVPVAPHTLSNRPIVLKSESKLEILMHRSDDARVRFDGHTHFDLHGDDKVTVTRYFKPVCLLHPEGHSYYHTLREKLLWNQKL